MSYLAAWEGRTPARSNESSVRVPVLSKQTSLILPHRFTLAQNHPHNLTPSHPHRSPLRRDAVDLLSTQSPEGVDSAHSQCSWEGGRHSDGDDVKRTQQSVRQVKVLQQ